MTVDELTLERAVRDRRFDVRTVEIARRLFLADEAPRQVAKEFGVIDKRVYAIRAAVLKQVETYQLRDGWSEVTLQGPIELLSELRELFEERMREAGESVPRSVSSRRALERP